jgi:hypothetical protein
VWNEWEMHPMKLEGGMTSFSVRALLVVCILGGLNVSAQVTAGDLRGVVTDPNGATVADATVRATSVTTGITSEATSTSVGVYVIGSLPVGKYHVEAQAQGFKTFATEDVGISTGTVSTLNIALQIGEIKQTVEVKETVTPLLQTTTSEVSTNVEQHVVMDLPLELSGDRRQVESFTFLTPGVTGTTFSKSFNGSPDLSQVAVVDGVAFSNAEVPGRFYTFSPPFEAVEEFKVSSTLYPAEIGRGFGVANYTLKSGGNQLHGDLFEFLRNDKLDARGFFASDRPIVRQNEFGGTVGGKIIKNRTFFFAAYDGFRLAGGSINRSLVTLPTDAFRQGDFSALVDGSGHQIPLYDPATTRPDGKGGFVRDVFPNNQIPLARLDPLAAKVIALMPQPDYPNLISGNYISRAYSPASKNDIAYKIDHQLTSHQKITFSHWFNVKESNPYIADWGKGQPLDWGYPGALQFHGIRANHDWVATPTVLNHFGFGFSGTFNTGRGTDPRNGVSILPVPGLPSQVPGVTGFNIPGSPEFGNATQQPDGRYDHTWNFTDTVSVVKGRHQLKFGGEYWWQTFRNWDRTGNGGTAGSFYFSNLETDNPDSATFGSAGYGFASFFLGQVDSLQRLVGATPFKYILPYGAAFVSDTVQLTPKLTLNVGLRYDFPSPWRFSDPKRLAAINLTTPNPGAGNLPGAYVFGNSALVPPMDKKEFGPRASLAYSPDSKTVVRVGYGIIYSISNASAIGAIQFGNGFTAGYTGFQNISSLNSGITAGSILANGFPQFTQPLPDQNAALNIGALADYYNHDAGKQAYTQTWTVDIQRQLPFQMFADVAYVGNKGQRLPASLENLNQVPASYLSLGPLLNQDINSTAAATAGFHSPYAGFAGTVGQALRAFPQYTSINDAFQPLGSSTYDALQAKVQKRFSNGLSFLVSYTFSKTLTNTSLSGYSAFNGGAMDTANRGIEKHIAGQDQTNNFITSLIYEIPVGKNITGAGGKLVRGWEVAAVLRYASGNPLSIGGGPPLPIFGGGNRPDSVRGVAACANISGTFDPAVDSYLNPAAFVQPAPYTFGTTPVTEPNCRSFPIFNEDFSVIKRTYIKERMNLEFRAEFFNVFNRVVFSAPSTNFNALNTFGFVFGQANTPRNIQFALKLNF